MPTAGFILSVPMGQGPLQDKKDVSVGKFIPARSVGTRINEGSDQESGFQFGNHKSNSCKIAERPPKHFHAERGNENCPGLWL